MQCALFEDDRMNLISGNPVSVSMYTICDTAGFTQGKIAVVKVFFLLFFLSYGPALASPLLGTSAIMCSPTLNSEPSKYMNHPEEKRGVHVDVCSSLSLFMGHSVTYEKIICFYMCPLVCVNERMCVCVCMCEFS